MKKISIILGTRPEAVKLCPVVQALRREGGFAFQVCGTGQHRELLDQVLEVFEVRPDVDFNLMEPDQKLAAFFGRAVERISQYLTEYQPDAILVQGDTTTVLAASLAAYYQRCRIGHVEAGLRTYNKYAPFPEELNRRLTSHLADYHFAPTPAARLNLLRESIPEDQIFVTGNTGIDALLFAVEKVRLNPPLIPSLPSALMKEERSRPLVLITGHRRENFGSAFDAICRAIAELAGRFREVVFVYPVHLNPHVREPVFRLLAGRQNIYLLEPLPYLEFVALMDRAELILTDSGGVQEEAPSLGKPVLVMRETTERPEGVEAGTARLLGTDPDNIIAAVSELLTDPDARQRTSGKANPYGDGRASGRILQILRERL